MQEECVVESVKNGLAYVGLKAKGNCVGCRACIFGKNKNNVVPAVMEVSCKTGDSVLVKLPEQEIKQASFILYLIPILFLLGGYFFGAIFKKELAQVICAFIFCAASFVLIYFIDKRFRKKNYMPIVTKIININKEIEKNG